MPEHMHSAADIPNQAEQASLAAEVCDNCVKERVELSTELHETLNETPEGRLQLVCAQEGLSLENVDQAVLLTQKPLSVAFKRPLPMSERIRNLCVVLLKEQLQGIPAPKQEPVNAEVREQLRVEASFSEGQQNTETRVAQKEQILESEQRTSERLDKEDAENLNTLSIGVTERDNQIERRDAIDNKIQDFIRSLPPGRLSEYREKAKDALETDEERELAEAHFAKYEEELKTLQAVFTPKEMQRVFGGNLTETVSLNLASNSKADIYRDVFTKIDAGFAHDDQRRREVRAQVAAKLGIKFNQVERPRNATEMQNALRSGRGTEQITETQRREDPPGSGNWVEEEVVVGERVIPFTSKDKLMLSQDPPIGIFPVSAGSETHRVEGAAAGQPIQAFELNIPENGDLPSAEIHMQTNKNIYETVFRSRGLAGSLQALLGEGDSTLSPNTETTNGVTDNDALQGLNKMFFGVSDVSSRFLSGAEIQRVHDHGTRWLVPGGDFGSFTAVDTNAAQVRLEALFGNDPAQMSDAMGRATPIINSGGAVTPSFEALYTGMHPDDAASGYPRLRKIVGADGMAVLNLPSKARKG